MSSPILYQPPTTITEHFDWLRRRWAHSTLRGAALMTYLGAATDDADADAQLRNQGFSSFRRMLKAGLLRPDLTIAEIGCGAGRVATELVDYLTDGSYIGVDLSPQYIALCQQRCPAGRFLVTPGIGFPIEDATTDLVVEFTVFCHMTTEAVWLWMRDVVRVLRPGGCTYLQFHNIASENQWQEFTTHADSHRFITDPGYPRPMEWATVERFHASVGLAIDAVHGVDEDAGGPRSWFVVARKT